MFKDISNCWNSHLHCVYGVVDCRYYHETTKSTHFFAWPSCDNRDLHLFLEISSSGKLYLYVIIIFLLYLGY